LSRYSESSIDSVGIICRVRRHSFK
jgi:hypothetical protein